VKALNSKVMCHRPAITSCEPFFLFAILKTSASGACSKKSWYQLDSRSPDYDPFVTFLVVVWVTWATFFGRPSYFEVTVT